MKKLEIPREVQELKNQIKIGYTPEFLEKYPKPEQALRRVFPNIPMFLKKIVIRTIPRKKEQPKINLHAKLAKAILKVAEESRKTIENNSEHFNKEELKTAKIIIEDHEKIGNSLLNLRPSKQEEITNTLLRLQKKISKLKAFRHGEIVEEQIEELESIKQYHLKILKKLLKKQKT